MLIKRLGELLSVTIFFYIYGIKLMWHIEVEGVIFKRASLNPKTAFGCPINSNSNRRNIE